jgi:radical SAM protein with 4Fe4S-binding SPASM domain
MPNKHFEYLVDQAKGLGAETISIFGYGEPLLDKGIEHKVAYCTDNGLQTFITTNGSLLNTEMASKLLKAGLGKIRLSVHGLYKTYDLVHRGLKFESVLRNIQNFLAFNNARFNHSCRVAMTVIPMHRESIKYIRGFWEEAVDELEIWRPHGWGGAKSFREPTEERKATCGRHKKGPVQIQADGRVIPCCFLTNAEVVLGDTYKNTIEEILKGGKYRKFRQRHDSGDLSGLPCETCDQLFVMAKSPLLYSNVDESCSIGKTSSTKFSLE